MKGEEISFFRLRSFHLLSFEVPFLPRFSVYTLTRAHCGGAESPDFYSKQAAEASSAIQVRKFFGTGDMGVSESLERISEISRTVMETAQQIFPSSVRRRKVNE